MVIWSYILQQYMYLPESRALFQYTQRPVCSYKDSHNDYNTVWPFYVENDPRGYRLYHFSFSDTVKPPYNAVLYNKLLHIIPGTDICGIHTKSVKHIPTNDTPYLVPYSRYLVSFVGI